VGVSSESGPRIVARRETKLSPWVTLVEKDVDFGDGGPPQTYHSLAQQDYVGVLARTPSGRIAIVRQYRPAIEQMTWELPAGLVDPGEEPIEAARRELLEEAGVGARRIVPLGDHAADVGRLGNRQHAFFAETDEPPAGFVPEPGITVAFVTRDELDARIRDGSFRHALHLAIVFLYDVRG
jgi:ADP-ribose pyrophosphatase